MAYGFSAPITVNGTANLFAELLAAGFLGDARIGKEGRIYNASAAVIAYLHFSNSNVNPPGVKQIETAVVVGTIITAGNSNWTLTAAGMTGSPKVIVVNLALGDTPYVIAAKAAAQFTADAETAAFFDIAASDANLILTRKTPAAGDATMNIAYANGTCAGLTNSLTSSNTRAGSLSTTNGFPIQQASTVVPSGVFVLPQETDLSTIWIHTPSSLPIQVAILG